MLRRWAVREHFVSEAYLRMYLSYCLLIFTHNSSKGLVVPFGVYELLAYFWFKTMTYLAVLTHTSFPEQISKTTWSITVIVHIHDL